MADYVSNYSGDQIDEAVGRALPGGRLEGLIAEKVPVLSRTVDIASDEDLIARIENAAASIRTNTAHGGAAILPIHFSAVHSVLGAANNTLLIRCVNDAVIEVVANVEAGGFTTRVQRIKTANGWGAFEYVNPPMQLGVEYRTTERYLGKPVYAKLVNFGALPNATSKVVEHGIASMSKIVSFSLCGFVGNECTYFLPSDGNYITRLSCSDRVIVVVAVTDMSSYTGSYAMIKYTKTTD